MMEADPPEEELPLFPLENGNRWSYVYTDGLEQNVDCTFIIAQADIEGVTFYKANAFFDDQNAPGYIFPLYEGYAFRWTPDGLFARDYARDGSIFGEYLFRFPEEASELGIYPHPEVPTQTQWRFTSELVSKDSTISTPAGMFETIVYRTIGYRYGEALSDREEYFVPGIGIVRTKSVFIPNGATHEWSLASYRVGDNPEMPGQ